MPGWKYTNLQSSLLIEPYQFIDSYTTIGYLESFTRNSLEIVKFKSKRLNKKQVFLISNDDCITVKKEQQKNKTVNKLIIDDIKGNQTGKILIDLNVKCSWKDNLCLTKNLRKFRICSR